MGGCAKEPLKTHQRVTFYFGIHDENAVNKTEDVFHVGCSFTEAGKILRIFSGIFKEWIRYGGINES